MWDLIVQHQFAAGVAALWIISAAVSSMPDPKPTSSDGYVWFYKFSHTIAGNLTQTFGPRIPGLKSDSAQAGK